MNIGRTPLHIYSQFIIPGTAIFSIGYGDDEFDLNPDSTHLTWLFFRPLNQTEYHATLTIESDDPDEETVEIPITGSALGIHLYDETLPTEFCIDEIYPNPFNSTITITYSLPIPATVTLGLYDLAGRKVSRLVDGNMQAGFHNVNLNADELPSGLYLVRLEAAGHTSVKKIMLLK